MYFYQTYSRRRSLALLTISSRRCHALRFPTVSLPAEWRQMQTGLIIKRQVYEAMFETLTGSFERSEQEMLASLQRADFKEGVAHFVEKRALVCTEK